MTTTSDSTHMITVYGADWCEDTRRSQRLLRRLHVPHRYVNIDDDLDGLERAKALNHGQRRTPTIDLGLASAEARADQGFLLRRREVRLVVNDHRIGWCFPVILVAAPEKEHEEHSDRRQ